MSQNTTTDKKTRMVTRKAKSEKRTILKRPDIWAFCYFSLFVIFGLCYSIWHNDFHQTTTLVEAGTQKIIRPLEKDLSHEFDSIITTFDGDLNSFRDVAVRITGSSRSYISFDTVYHYTATRQTSPGIRRLSCMLTIPPERSDDNPSITSLPISITDPLGFFLTAFAIGGRKGYGGYTFLGNLRARIDRNSDDFEKPGTLDGMFMVSESMLKLIRDYQKIASGKPLDDLSRFLRSFYLSAVTITTLGYGDLVPITNWARVLVALESVLGVSVAGLFLMSLANKFK